MYDMQHPEATRLSVFYLPPEGPLSAFGARWLGWDPVAGRHVAQSDPPFDMEALTGTPRRYGLHGTIVPPFRFGKADVGEIRDGLRAAFTDLPTLRLSGLELATLGRFLALVPVDGNAALRDLAAGAMQATDRFRLPPSPADLKRHRAKGLSAWQEAYLKRWGYPYVMEEFRFHITLTARLPKPQLREVQAFLGTELADCLANPFEIDSLALMAEGADGLFRLVERFPLGGRLSPSQA